MKHIKKYKKGGKKFPDLTGDGKVTMADILKGRGVEKAGKGMKYKHGGKKDPVKEARKKIDAANASDKSTAGKARQSSLKSKNATQAIIERSRGAGSQDAAKLIAKKGLAPRTMMPKGALSAGTKMAKDFRERDRKTGMSPKSSRYQVPSKPKSKKLKVKKAMGGMKHKMPMAGKGMKYGK